MAIRDGAALSVCGQARGHIMIQVIVGQLVRCGGRIYRRMGEADCNTNVRPRAWRGWLAKPHQSEGAIRYLRYGIRGIW